MSNEIAIKQEFTTEQIDLIKTTVAVGATDNELNLFLYQAKRTGLDPLARQIYFVKRQGKVTIQTSIDGFRVIAERSKDYAGQDEPEFEKVKKFTGNGEDIKCSVRIYKWSPMGERYIAATGVAYWSEYCPPAGQDFMWKKMPRTMLAKVAEALGLRKAFPQDLSGVYTSDEMEQEPVKEEIKNVDQPQAQKAVEYDEMDDLGAVHATAKNSKKSVTADEVLAEADKFFNK